MTERKRPSPEEVDLILRTAARRRRPWTLPSVLLALLVFVVPVVLLVWWMWPSPPSPRLVVLTFDQLATPNQTLTLRARLLPAEAGAEDRLGGQTVFFQDVRPLRPAGHEPWQDKTTSTPDGSAGVEWRAPAETGLVDFAARYVGAGQKHGSEDKGRIFVWPPEARLLVVGVQGTLTDASAKAWQAGILREIPRTPGAAAALQTVQAKGYHVVYLALAADRPLTYRKVRDWVLDRPMGAEKSFPSGPVLGRSSYGEESSEGSARQAILSGLTKHFTGPLVAVVGHAQDAEAYRAAGLTVVLFGAGEEELPGVTRVKTWAAVAGHLPK